MDSSDLPSTRSTRKSKVCDGDSHFDSFGMVKLAYTEMEQDGVLSVIFCFREVAKIDLTRR